MTTEIFTDVVIYEYSLYINECVQMDGISTNERHNVSHLKKDFLNKNRTSHYYMLPNT